MARRDEHGSPVELDAGGRTVTITSPDKVMFPGEPGGTPLTKADLANHYLSLIHI